MKKLLLFSQLMSCILITILFFNCQPNNGSPATLSTSDVVLITPTSYTGGGNITNDGGTPVAAKGICWSTNQNPTIQDNKTTDGSGTGSFSSSITGLSLYTTYYVRAYATNSFGTTYGNQVTFKSGIIYDVEGNDYRTIQIGSQIWMADNLRTSKYKNGVSIQTGLTQNQWKTTTAGAWCYFNDNASYNNDYGKLYNYYAVNNTNGLNIIGWHIPSLNELHILADFLSDTTTAGGYMKETGTTYWYAPNTGATNSSKFNGRGGGYRNWDGAYTTMKYNGIWWTGHLVAIDCAEYFLLNADREYIMLDSDFFPMGFSVRFIKD